MYKILIYRSTLNIRHPFPTVGLMKVLLAFYRHHPYTAGGGSWPVGGTNPNPERWSLDGSLSRSFQSKQSRDHL